MLHETQGGKLNVKKRMFVIVILAAIITIIATALTGCESCSREIKTVQSDLTGGLDRVITVYDNTGNVLKSYEGKPISKMESILVRFCLT